MSKSKFGWLFFSQPEKSRKQWLSLKATLLVQAFMLLFLCSSCLDSSQNQTGKLASSTETKTWPYPDQINSIPVCWINDVGSNEASKKVRELVESEYAKAGICFSGWDQCSTETPCPAIRVHLGIPQNLTPNSHTTGGSYVGAFDHECTKSNIWSEETMWINTNWANTSQISETGVMRLFGFALGFVPEELRDDNKSNQGGTSARKEDGPFHITEYDHDSVMNSNSDNISLSQLDINGIETFFGINGNVSCSDNGLDNGSLFIGSDSDSDSLDLDIPDNNSSGVSHTIHVTHEEIIKEISVYVDIKHTYIQDLVVTLTRNDRTILLRNRAGGSTNNITKYFNIDDFDGETLRGDWTLNIMDLEKADTGKLLSWGLKVVPEEKENTECVNDPNFKSFCDNYANAETCNKPELEVIMLKHCCESCKDRSASRGKDCGGIAGLECPENQFCKFTEGGCNTADAMGVCTSYPQLCTAVYVPICGCNGKTYSNQCSAESAGQSVDYQGECI